VQAFPIIKRLSLTTRLIALTLVASLPGLIALGYSAFDLRNTRYSEVHAEALRNARFVVSEVDQIFDGIEGILYAVSQTSAIQSKDGPQCLDYLGRIRAKLDQLTSILVVNVDGSIRCYSEGVSSPVNLSDRDYFKEAMASRKFTVGTYTASRISDRHIIPIALPVLKDGEVDFLITAGLNLEWFGTTLRERGLASGSAITIADRNGIVVSREPFPERFVGRKFDDSFMPRLGADAESIELRSRDGTDRIMGYVPPHLTPFNLYVSSGISRAESFGPIDRAVRGSIALFALGSVVALVLAWLVGESIIRQPLMRMVATAEAWRRGEDSARTGLVNRGDEIGLLGHTFDRLMDENDMREQQRNEAETRREILVHELAHRVKNTLATVQSIAAMSFREKQGPEALRQFQDRLQALVRSHDLLTKTDWQHADLADVAAAAMAPLREESGHRFSMSGPSVELPPSTAVPMAMILHELTTNAMKYGALSNDDGQITINWTAVPDERGTALSLSWHESGGPRVDRPSHEGFGSRLIASLTKQMNGGYDVRYPPSGLVCHLRLVTPHAEPRE
jgi:two-component sensor histidine kinase